MATQIVSKMGWLHKAIASNNEDESNFTRRAHELNPWYIYIWTYNFKTIDTHPKSE